MRLLRNSLTTRRSFTDHSELRCVLAREARSPWHALVEEGEQINRRIYDL
ncbi:hypothetical protein HDF11_004690 [Tunturiibacter psychrotolerans]